MAGLAVDLAVDQDVGAFLVVIPVVAGRELEVPVHLAVIGVPGDHGVSVEVVAGAVGGIEHRNRIAGAPDHLVRGDVVGPGHPHGAAAGLPGVVLVLPGFAAGLAGRRDRVFAPFELAGLGVEPGDIIAHAAIAAGRPDDDLVLDGERRRRDLHVRLLVGQVGLPDNLGAVPV